MKVSVPGFITEIVKTLPVRSNAYNSGSIMFKLSSQKCLLTGIAILPEPETMPSNRRRIAKFEEFI